MNMERYDNNLLIFSERDLLDWFAEASKGSQCCPAPLGTTDDRM